ncbi:contractile injection system protein, VgrG/Pvc8 family [Xenorhabdus sp. XENO-1]|uniref:contractile injection system protein, VgrG/Pvc8 family n=1 Tax=Xenorhabdus bovienii TaxID=40576 RepID=UPI0020CA68B8|nr:contractile injection system protein, VgrG/Pvc8 family [Xenorhabdus bovienii]MCP9269462.1 contractile injection system protein, VgrG/Pvc8 family [Xenorhabdus bovienii subsp. africana]
MSMVAFSLESNNKDISALIQSRLISLTMTDNPGLESDELYIELDDSDKMLRLPSRGDILTLKLGWHRCLLTPKGKFVVDEIGHSGPPDRLTIRARSADFRGKLNMKREFSYHAFTLGKIVRTVASRYDLDVKMSEYLENIFLRHTDQTDESDVSFLARLARREGAIFSIKNGELLFIRQGQNKNASGTDIPLVVITRDLGDSHRFSLSDRNAYTGVIAQWWDTKLASEQTVTVRQTKSKTTKAELSFEYGSSKDESSDEKPKKGKPSVWDNLLKGGSIIFGNLGAMNLANGRANSKNGKPSTSKSQGVSDISIDGSISYEEQKKSEFESHQSTTVQQQANNYLEGEEGNVLKLSQMYPDKESAQRAATNMWEKARRGTAQFSITLAMGRADIYPETPVHIEGFKPEINGTSWTVVKVTHNLNDSGFTTSLELEIKLDDVEIKTENTEINT